MDEFIDVKIDVFEHTGQRARLRKTLTANALIDEILREFDDITADAPGKYAIYLKGVDRPLNATSTLIQLDIQPQDELVFDYIHQTIRQALELNQYAFLREETTGKTYDIQWQPAVIGRPTNEVDHNIMLAVNVLPLPEGMTISRKHAQVTFSGGRYYIEALAENNTVKLNGKEVPLNAKRELKNGDRLVLGRNNLTLTFLTQNPTSPTPIEARGQSQKPAVPASAAIREVPSQPVIVSQSAASVPDAATRLGGIQVARLVLEQGSAPALFGQQLELLAFPFLLGRDLPAMGSENEVSRRHAEVSYDPASRKYFVTDLHSTNGVFLEGARLDPDRPYEIRPGARIGLGQKLILRFEA